MSDFGNGKQPTIVILRALALGDLLTALPALRALRRAFPNHRLILTCPPWLKPLAQFIKVADYFIEGAYFEKENEDTKQYRIPNDLQSRIELEKAQLNELQGILTRPDIAVNLRGERIATHQVLLALNPNRYIGFYNQDIPETEGYPIWNSNEHEIIRWCRLLQENNIPTDPSDIHFVPPDINIPNFVKGATIIHPGAGSPARYWPIERWAAVAKWETQQGNKVIITGSIHEIKIASIIAELAELPANVILAGKTDILELAAFCGNAKRIICTDTGIAHLAVALRTPSVTLFGPMPPSRWGPPQYLPQHRILWNGMNGEPYSSIPDEGLLKIFPENVISEIIILEKKGY